MAATYMLGTSIGSMEALRQLRAVNVQRQQTQCIRHEVSKQFEHITKLRVEKELLSHRLKHLLEGSSPYTVNENDSLELLEIRQTLTTLMEKISAHKMLGPCGLTVLEVNEKILVLTFNAIWKNLAQSFILKLSLLNNAIKVTGTDIPYFVDVSTLLDNCSSDELPDKMDNISLQLSAYVHRKREVQYVEDEFKEYLRSMFYDHSITSVDMKIYLPGFNRTEMTVHLWYDKIENVLPDSIDITAVPGAKSMLSDTTRAEIRQLYRENPLSVAFPAVMDSLKPRQRNQEAKGLRGQLERGKAAQTEGERRSESDKGPEEEIGDM